MFAPCSYPFAPFRTRTVRGKVGDWRLTDSDLAKENGHYENIHVVFFGNFVTEWANTIYRLRLTRIRAFALG